MKKPEGAALVIGDGNLPCQLATIRKKCPTEEKNGQMKLLVPLKLDTLWDMTEETFPNSIDDVNTTDHKINRKIRDHQKKTLIEKINITESDCVEKNGNSTPIINIEYKKEDGSIVVKKENDDQGNNLIKPNKLNSSKEEAKMEEIAENQVVQLRQTGSRIGMIGSKNKNKSALNGSSPTVPTPSPVSKSPILRRKLSNSHKTENTNNKNQQKNSKDSTQTIANETKNTINAAILQQINEEKELITNNLKKSPTVTTLSTQCRVIDLKTGKNNITISNYSFSAPKSNIIKISTKKDVEILPYPLKRTQNFSIDPFNDEFSLKHYGQMTQSSSTSSLASLGVASVPQRQLSNVQTSSRQNAQLEEKQIVQTLIKIRKTREIERKCCSGNYLMDALNQSKASRENVKSLENTQPHVNDKQTKQSRQFAGVRKQKNNPATSSPTVSPPRFEPPSPSNTRNKRGQAKQKSTSPQNENSKRVVIQTAGSDSEEESTDTEFSPGRGRNRSTLQKSTKFRNQRENDVIEQNIPPNKSESLVKYLKNSNNGEMRKALTIDNMEEISNGSPSSSMSNSSCENSPSSEEINNNQKGKKEETGNQQGDKQTIPEYLNHLVEHSSIKTTTEAKPQGFMSFVQSEMGDSGSKIKKPKSTKKNKRKIFQQNPNKLDSSDSNFSKLLLNQKLAQPPKTDKQIVQFEVYHQLSSILTILKSFNNYNLILNNSSNSNIFSLSNSGNSFNEKGISLINEITLPTGSKLNENRILETSINQFLKKIRVCQPIVDTIIDEVSPGDIRHIIATQSTSLYDSHPSNQLNSPNNPNNSSGSNNSLNLTTNFQSSSMERTSSSQTSTSSSISSYNWYDIKFYGSAYLYGIINLNHQYEIFNRILDLSHKDKLQKERYIYSILQTIEHDALEQLNEFKFDDNIQITKVDSGYNSSVCITDSGGFFVIAATQLSGISLGQENGIDNWTGSYYIPSFQQHIIEQVSCGGGHFAALSKAGDVFTWGLNCDIIDGKRRITGQLGHSYDTYISIPSHVSKIQGFAYDIACGYSHTVVITTTGVYTFGSSEYYQLGREDLSNINHKISKERSTRSGSMGTLETGGSGLLNKNFYSEGTSFHSINLNIYKQKNKKTSPQTAENSKSQKKSELKYYGDVELIKDSNKWKAIQVKCGRYYTMVLTNTGTIVGWGLNENGQISSDHQSIIKKPVFIQHYPKFTQIACGSSHTLGLTSFGFVYSWGSNFSGELGVDNATKLRNNKLNHIESLKDITFISCGPYNSSAVNASGEVYIWGLLSNNGLTSNQFTPRMIEKLADNHIYVSYVSCGATHSIIMSDHAATNALNIFHTAIKYEGWYNSTQIRLVLLSLSDPNRMIKPIQDRVIDTIKSEDKIMRAFITVDKAFFSFFLNYDSTVVSKTVTVKNTSPFRVKVSAVFDGLCVSKTSSYQIKISPTEQVIIPKKSSVQFTITVKCLRLPPVDDASGLLYFVVQPARGANNISEISRYFIMCSILPPLDFSNQMHQNDDQSNQSKYTTNDLAEIMRREYTQTLNTINKLKAFLPNSLLNIFSTNTDTPRSLYSEIFPAAIIFLDISGFTMLTARLAQVGDAGPETVSKHVNGYFEPLINTAAAYGGEFVKSAGDAIMCMFREQPEENLPVEILALRAVTCGLEIQKNFAVYDSGEGFTLTLHIGISIGNVTLLFVGGVNNQWMYILTGDPLSQLSSCVDSSKYGEVVISRQCKEMVGKYCELTPINNDFMVTSVNYDHPFEFPSYPSCEYDSSSSSSLRSSSSNHSLSSSSCCFSSSSVISPSTSNSELSSSAINTTSSPLLLSKKQANEPRMKSSPEMSTVNTNTLVNSNNAHSSPSLTESPKSSSKKGSRVLHNQYASSSNIKDLVTKCPLIEPKVPIAAEGVLRSFVHPAVLARLQSNEFQLDELRTITSIFVKLIINTKYNNKYEHELYCSSLHKAFCCMQEQVVKQEGMICQFLQDDKGIILFAAFGVPPNSHADDAFRAVKTAIDIREKLFDQLQIQCAIGIFTGFVFTGVVGSEQRHDYTVLGDTVNMSARLMAKAYELDVGILVGQTTYESCNLRLKFHSHTPVLVKGKDTPINIYSPEVNTSASLNQQSIVQATATNIIGREDELYLLCTVISELKEHYSMGLHQFYNKPTQLTQIVIIEGPAGSGKSFLAQFSSRISSEIGLTVCYGHSLAINAITPYYTWRGVIKSLYDLESKTDIELNEFISTIKKILTEDLVLQKFLPLLNAVIPLPFTRSQLDSVSKMKKEEVQHYTCELIKRIIEFKSCQNPLVIILEDIQWMDVSSIRVFDHLSSSAHSILIVATTRELSQQQRQQFSNLNQERTERRVLEPLSYENCETIIMNYLNMFDRFPREFQHLVHQVQGNPLYCEELARNIQNVLIKGKTASHGSCELPNSVEGLISSRLDLLPVSAQNLIKIASVIGYEFEVAVLQGIYDEKFTNDIKLLMQQNFIVRSTASTFAFRNGATWKVAYTRLLVSKRRELHQKIAEWYEKQQIEQIYGILSHHWYEALEGQTAETVNIEILQKVIGYMQKSADIATQMLAIDEAAGMIQRALKLTELFPPKIKGPYSKRLKLQLVGLPVRNLHGFNMDETELKVRFGAPGSNSLNDDTTLRHQLNSTTSIPNLNSLSVLNQNAPLDVRPTEKPESILQGLLRKRNKWGRWHPIYCVLHNTSFRMYLNKDKTTSNKPSKEIDIKFASIRRIMIEGEKCIAISRKKHPEMTLSSEEGDLQNWLSALIAVSEIPAITFDLCLYSLPLIIISPTGKIENCNLSAEKLFGYSVTEIFGKNITFLCPDGQIRSAMKSKARDIAKIKTFGRNKREEAIHLFCSVGEFTENGEYKYLVSFRIDTELTDEIRVILECSNDTFSFSAASKSRPKSLLFPRGMSSK